MIRSAFPGSQRPVPWPPASESRFGFLSSDACEAVGRLVDFAFATGFDVCTHMEIGRQCESQSYSVRVLLVNLQPLLLS